jgi:hypothetical protein
MKAGLEIAAKFPAGKVDIRLPDPCISPKLPSGCAMIAFL